MNDLVDGVREYCAREARDDRFSGVVLLARGEDVLLAESYNRACRRFDVSNTVDTRFDIASLGKMFAGVAIAQLVEAGRIRFDAPVATYLPSWPRGVGEQVTIHHVLTHTSGLGSIFDGGWDVASKARFRTVDDILPYFRDRALLFAPGTAWEYSNAGYVLLGAIIEAVTGMGYFEYLDAHIYAPAAMRDTGPYSLDQEIPGLAFGYSRESAEGRVDSEPRWNNVYRHWSTSTPAGCLYSTVSDLLRFMHALRAGLLLSSSLVSLVTGGRVFTRRRPGEQYGYGFFVDRLDGIPVFGHGGTIPGYQAWLDVFPSLDLTAIVLTNLDAPSARDLAWLIRERVTGVTPPPILS